MYEMPAMFNPQKHPLSSAKNIQLPASQPKVTEAKSSDTRQVSYENHDGEWLCTRGFGLLNIAGVISSPGVEPETWPFAVLKASTLDP